MSSLAGERVLLVVPAEHNIVESLPVLHTHHGVQQGVEVAGQIVEDS